VTFEFAPQRTVNAMLAVSAVAGLGCIGLAAWPRRRRHHTFADALDPAFVSARQPRLRWPRRASAAVAATTVSFLLAGPAVAACIAVAAVAGTNGGRSRLLVRLGAPGALAIAALYVIVQQIRHSTAPGLEWPTELERVHPLGWLAVLLLATELVLCRLGCDMGTEADKERREDEQRV
jgi:hypothetical protein